MSNKEEYLTANYYQRLLGEYGQSYKSLNWGSHEGQQLRFKILSEITQLEGMHILDVGCGLGDFAGWLTQNDIRVNYTGLELAPELVEQARKSYPELSFVQGSITDETLFSDQQFDFVFASGIFYTYSEVGDAWLRVAVSRMWSLCNRGVAFNSLSSWADTHDAHEYYADPQNALAYCKMLTPWVALRHDYHPRDFTIYLSRKARK